MPAKRASGASPAFTRRRAWSPVGGNDNPGRAPMRSYQVADFGAPLVEASGRAPEPKGAEVLL